ncbi:pentatricopeptide repeat-containing protein At2g20710, mitochondrial [Morus notabilis]|uniref:pentatricopeptide repeat-containing protein At2g20710, mitochondrial n=1 Tax=Morus notabilis TaxID=981085 RepID=UPI000CED3771|nr:pentatricopeptide repeat-containing protein At2g20710, mitochondrial [Morus notabilis]
MRVWERSRLALRSVFGAQNQNVSGRFFYSSISNPTNTNIEERLYRRISPVGNPNVSVVPILEQWVQEGKPVSQIELQRIIKELRIFKRFHHALEISQWMSDKRYMHLSTKDVAARLDLISKVHGLDEAVNYFNDIPAALKIFEVYSTLLNCYANEKSVEKAEEIMQQMRDMWDHKTPICYNIMMNLYYHTEDYDKLDSLMSEMEEKGIPFDTYTFSIRMSAYVAISDVEGVNKIMEKVESYPGLVLDWNFYSVAASSHLNVGLVDKAVEMLKKLEDRLPTVNRKSFAFDALLKSYALIGNRDELYRIWDLYKKEKLFNKGYKSMICSLLRIDDVEGAAKIYEEWESRGLPFDFLIPDLMIDTYFRKGLLEKAEALVDKAIAKGDESSVELWYYLVIRSLEHNQISKAVEALKKAISVWSPGSKPSKETLSVCLEYLDGKVDIEGAQMSINLLRTEGISYAASHEKWLNFTRGGDSMST